jgi:hypothetical protein
MVTDMAAQLADWITVLPLLAGEASDLGPEVGLYDVLYEKRDRSEERRPIESAPRVDVVDACKLLKWAARHSMFARLLDPTCARLKTAMGLLASARRIRRTDLAVVLSLSALEAMCELPKDEQIQRRVKDCATIMFAPGEKREGVRKRLQGMYDRRNVVVVSHVVPPAAFYGCS